MNINKNIYENTCANNENILLSINSTHEKDVNHQAAVVVSIRLYFQQAVP